ncbi:unnamed protein product [Allacma fusca]|uniref:Uncharacterized protein n=1 Tax=Allacma fusca TaxID=39272 RepID=A0A8J2P092_9HEXA|nr:unnamed protein product [Allacma fusca]
MVNAQSKGSKRSVANTKKQWIDLKSNAKKQAAKIYQNIRKTGGGKHESEMMDQVLEKIAMCENWARKIVRMIGDEAFIGIEDGIDFSSSETDNKSSTDDNAGSSKRPRIEASTASIELSIPVDSDTNKLKELVPKFSQETEEFFDAMVKFILQPEGAGNTTNQCPKERCLDGAGASTKTDEVKGKEKPKKSEAVSERMLVVQEGILAEIRIMNENFAKLIDVAYTFPKHQ